MKKIMGIWDPHFSSINISVIFTFPSCWSQMAKWLAHLTRKQETWMTGIRGLQRDKGSLRLEQFNIKPLQYLIVSFTR